MSRQSGDSADPCSTGAFKAGRVEDDPFETGGGKGCRGCVVSPSLLVVRFLWLVALSLSLPGAIVAAGWSYQLSRRVARWPREGAPSAVRRGGRGVTGALRPFQLRAILRLRRAQDRRLHHNRRRL